MTLFFSLHYIIIYLLLTPLHCCTHNSFHVIPISPKHFMFCGLLAGCGEVISRENGVWMCGFYERFGLFGCAVFMKGLGCCSAYIVEVTKNWIFEVPKSATSILKCFSAFSFGKNRCPILPATNKIKTYFELRFVTIFLWIFLL